MLIWASSWQGKNSSTCSKENDNFVGQLAISLRQGRFPYVTIAFHMSQNISVYILQWLAMSQNISVYILHWFAICYNISIYIKGPGNIYPYILYNGLPYVKKNMSVYIVQWLAICHKIFPYITGNGCPYVTMRIGSWAHTRGVQLFFLLLDAMYKSKSFRLWFPSLAYQPEDAIYPREWSA